MVVRERSLGGKMVRDEWKRVSWVHYEARNLALRRRQDVLAAKVDILSAISGGKYIS